ncbi:RagB/SusD family nutrient uptake outer membrane protein [Seonamhaeicola sediminis]|uniref:RagB/SusD family nutrient uptake outer membrane protein n=1 Tax=Seonamhaeicola sediminis TaxID=2528206 RepID=A0A562YHS4_9FLAO|nr:RagB/SusD family nutrient uptake outer membrane protein [Seonamhaeicola sediminis]TWO34612.1 RagB/SusD family nutrient uptake outer membrane protein [Seonamhaeicola sediminis]
MKNLKYIFLLLVLPILGCSDLEEEPVSVLSPDGFFKSIQDVQTVINGSYGNMATEAFWGRKFSLPLMLRSDMVGIGDQGTAGRRKDHDNFSVADDNGMITAFWPRTYQIIAGANEAIVGGNGLGLAEESINPVVAQAHFVRAYTYFHLVRLFGDIPYFDTPVQNIAEASQVSKTPQATVYANIIADLEFAKQWLPDTQPSSALPTKASAAGYLALVHLTMNNFQDAYNEAKFVIDNEARFGLELAADFQDLFDATKQSGLKEALFTIDHNGFRDGNYGQDYTAALTGIRANEDGNGGGWSVAVPSVEVYNRWDGRDYRKAVSLDTIGVFNGAVDTFVNFPTYDARNIPSAYIAKYARYTGQTSNGNGRGSEHNYAQLRYAEVLLIAAEALNEVSPGSTEADGYVNRVRARARSGNGSSFPADVTPGMSQLDFRNMVLEERRWELAFEFKRWYDIKRRDLGTQAFGTGGFEERPNFNPTRDYLLPLPNDELQRNPNLEPQNPGY